METSIGKFKALVLEGRFSEAILKKIILEIILYSEEKTLRLSGGGGEESR